MSPERAFAGGAVLTVSAAGATTAYATGLICLGTAFVVVGLLGLAVTGAKWIPVLHRLPRVGAIPPPEVRFRLEAPSDGMTFNMDPAAEARVLLSAGVEGGRRNEITRVLVNAGVVGATDIYRTEPDGSPYHDGGRRGRGQDGLYWSISNVTIPLGAFEMFFKVTIPEPGEYEVVLMLQSPDLHDKGDHRYTDKLVARARTPS